MGFRDGKQSRLLVPILLLAIAGLAALNYYQNNVIQHQSTEIRWLMSQGIVVGGKPAAAWPAADPALPGPGVPPAGTPHGQKSAEPLPKSR